MKSKLTEKNIQSILYNHYNHMNYKLSNIYMFDNGETDFFLTTMSNYMWDIEIKRDSQDFKNEFKNKVEKHKILSDIYNGEDVGDRFIPNCFYFCAPKGIINPDEIPEYAGFIEITESYNSCKYVKKAPKIHKKKYDYKEKVLDKLYFKHLKLEKSLSTFKKNVEKTKGDKSKILNEFLKKISS